MQSKPLTPRVLELTTAQNSKFKIQNSKLREAVVLDGRSASAEIRRRCAEEVQALLAKRSILPGLAVGRVGEDPPSVQYGVRIVKCCGAPGRRAPVFARPS